MIIQVNVVLNRTVVETCLWNDSWVQTFHRITIVQRTINSFVSFYTFNILTPSENKDTLFYPSSILEVTITVKKETKKKLPAYCTCIENVLASWFLNRSGSNVIREARDYINCWGSFKLQACMVANYVSLQTKKVRMKTINSTSTIMILSQYPCEILQFNNW